MSEVSSKDLSIPRVYAGRLFSDGAYGDPQRYVLESDYRSLQRENTALRNIAENLRPGPISEALAGAAPEPPPESEPQSCTDADGCPQETAVLQRFWRQHQANAEPRPFREWAADIRTQSLQRTTQAYKAKIQKLEYEMACRPAADSAQPPGREQQLRALLERAQPLLIAAGLYTSSAVEAKTELLADIASALTKGSAP